MEKDRIYRRKRQIEKRKIVLVQVGEKGIREEKVLENRSLEEKRVCVCVCVCVCKRQREKHKHRHTNNYLHWKTIL